MQKRIGYENCKVVNMQRPWKYYRKMARNITPTQSGVSVLNQGYMQTSQPQPTQCFGTIIQGLTGPTTETVDLALLMYTYYVTTIGRC
jgi:hypothetical protein